jgi:hypothetical protein
MNDFLLDLNTITDISVLEALRAHLANQAHSAELTWKARIVIYEKIQAIANRSVLLERM